MKKASGIVRQLDQLGRVVLPIEMRRSLDISARDSVEITADNSGITLRRHETACVFCGAVRGLKDYQGKKICESCAREIGKL